jgi:hypothetical protein
MRWTSLPPEMPEDARRDAEESHDSHASGDLPSSVEAAEAYAMARLLEKTARDARETITARGPRLRPASPKGPEFLPDHGAAGADHARAACAPDDSGNRPLAAALLVIPSIPLAAWFSVLWFYYRQEMPVPAALTLAMVAVGILFVVNSLDSLIRLYSDNLGLTAGRMGKPAYVAGHWLLMCGLVLAFEFTPLQIEWIGLVVIGLYAAIYLLLIRRWRVLRDGRP